MLWLSHQHSIPWQGRKITHNLLQNKINQKITFVTLHLSISLLAPPPTSSIENSPGSRHDDVKSLPHPVISVGSALASALPSSPLCEAVVLSWIPRTGSSPPFWKSRPRPHPPLAIPPSVVPATDHISSPDHISEMNDRRAPRLHSLVANGRYK